MLIGDRIRALRELKNLSQGDIKRRTGVLRAYISRVEHGHTVPAIETLEKLARALEVPLYRLFYEGKKPPELSELPERLRAGKAGSRMSKKDMRFWRKLVGLLSRMKEPDGRLLLSTSEKMAKRQEDLWNSPCSG